MIIRPSLLVSVPVLASLVPWASAFYLPGAAPKDYLPGDPVSLLVNSVTPGSSQLKSIISCVPFASSCYRRRRTGRGDSDTDSDIDTLLGRSRGSGSAPASLKS